MSARSTRSKHETETHFSYDIGLITIKKEQSDTDQLLTVTDVKLLSKGSNVLKKKVDMDLSQIENCRFTLVSKYIIECYDSFPFPDLSSKSLSVIVSNVISAASVDLRGLNARKDLDRDYISQEMFSGSPNVNDTIGFTESLNHDEIGNSHSFKENVSLQCSGLPSRELEPPDSACHNCGLSQSDISCTCDRGSGLISDRSGFIPDIVNIPRDLPILGLSVIPVGLREWGCWGIQRLRDYLN